MEKVYTLGFMFSENGNKVLLILKDRPEWQKGKLNGIGGKYEEGDISYFRTQVREFEEETGIKTRVEDWNKFCTITGTETEKKTGTEIGSVYKIHCYKCFSNKIEQAKKIESEEPVIVNIWDINQRLTVPNIQWLVPMALNHKGSVLEIKYN